MMAGGVSCHPFDVRFSCIWFPLPQATAEPSGKGCTCKYTYGGCAHTQSTLGELIRARELQVCLPDPLRSRLIAYLELQFRASKLPRAGSCAWHFLVGSWPGGGSSWTPPAPQGVPPLPELKSETLSHVVPSVDVWSQEVNRSDNYRFLKVQEKKKEQFSGAKDCIQHFTDGRSEVHVPRSPSKTRAVVCGRCNHNGAV